jgi:hypothetical protein
MLYCGQSVFSATLPGSVSWTRVLRGELPDRWTRLRGRSCAGKVTGARGKVRSSCGNLPREEREKDEKGGKRRATRWSECFRMVLYPVAGMMLWCLHLLRRRREGPGPLRRVGIRWRADRRRLGNRLADRSEVSGTFPLGKVPRFVLRHRSLQDDPVHHAALGHGLYMTLRPECRSCYLGICHRMTGHDTSISDALNACSQAAQSWLAFP